ncbi:hypothetical protein HMPREF0494_0503 [Limosilactobacillus antri DSM 16041]|uniref:Uncharacterized protein n=1 Tax=Limosilactobacillus antri DSM 16041 TaxID=525309 RepID=C8P5A9_9LACO|nr:hypothetical protein HMPREF0494_0503 [Limosilactobacillus antri DSM 16041]KRK59936.1 hypothetical protein FC31_GL000211 [Limosilactobacillus antri DSM 16041]
MHGTLLNTNNNSLIVDIVNYNLMIQGKVFKINHYFKITLHNVRDLCGNNQREGEQAMKKRNVSES